MVRNFRFVAVFAVSLLTAGCYVQPYGSGYNGYKGSYGYGSNPSAPSYAAATPGPQTLPPTSVATAPQSTPPAVENAPTVPVSADNAASAADSVVDGGSQTALPPLVLPIREDWSSAKCPALGVTFTGNSQPARSSLAATASFEEARQFRENDYAEVAECFCVKKGDLADIPRSTVDAVMSEMARQLSGRLNMQVKSISYVASSPLGRYSQLEASTDDPATKTAIMRIYWHGQCSVRVAVVSKPETQLRAEEFLNSLRALNGEPRLITASATPAEVAPSAIPPSAIPPSAIPTNILDPLRALRDEPIASPDASATALPPDGSHDLEAELKDKVASASTSDPETPPAIPAEPVTAPPAPDTAAAAPAPSQDAAAAPSQDPASAQAAAPATETAAAGQDIAAKLQELKGLRRQGLISQSEYNTKRQTILSGL